MEAQQSNVAKPTTPVKPKTRPVRAKAAPKAKAVVEPKVEVSPASAPVSVPTAPVSVQPETSVEVPSETVVEPSTETKKAPKVDNGVCISAARIRRHLDKMALNKMIDSAINGHKATISAYELAKTQNAAGKCTHLDDKKVSVTRDLTQAEIDANTAAIEKLAPLVPVCTAKIAALSRERSRFSNESSLVLAVICDKMINQIATHTMDRTLAAGKRIIQVAYMHEAGIESLPLYPLFRTLPSFVANKQKFDSAAAEASLKATINAAVAAAEREFKKKLPKVKAGAKKESVVPDVALTPAATPVGELEPGEITEAEAAAEVVAETDDSDDSKTSFIFYVRKVSKALSKSDERYKCIRISTEICNYWSNLLVDFITRTAPLILLTANSMKNKTINNVAIMRTIEFIMTDGHTPVETIELREELVIDPEAVKAEVAKRDAEKAAGREYKIEAASIPKIPGFVATRTLGYPTSGFEALNAEVKAKLEVYNQALKKSAAEHADSASEHAAESTTESTDNLLPSEVASA